MKKIIKLCVTAAAIVTTSQADFSLENMLKEMKEAACTFCADTKATTSALKDESTKTSKDTTMSVSSNHQIHAIHTTNSMNVPH